MSRPAFIVDGYQEKKIVQQLCPNAPIRLLNRNGRDVELHAAAKRVVSLIRLLGNRYYPFVIIFDREERKESSSRVAEVLRELILSEGIVDDLVIGVPDRMIENWLLADWATVQSLGKLKTPKSQIFEGCNGKAAIKKLLPKGNTYQETVQGVEWFSAVNVNALFRNSSSFYHFVNELEHLDCLWLRPCF